MTGYKARSYQITYENGVEVNREIVATDTYASVGIVVRKGTQSTANANTNTDTNVNTADTNTNTDTNTNSAQPAAPPSTSQPTPPPTAVQTVQ